jgi:O-antigen/teichoic acid export membrane protein
VRLRSIIARLSEKVSHNRASIFGVSAKFLNGVNWLVIAAAVSTSLSKDLQGYFFTFLSLVTVQMLFDLGLGTAVIQFTAHEWGCITELNESARRSPAASRLASIAQFSIYWYTIAAIVFFLALQVVGFFFFHNAPEEGVWPGPWLILSIFVALDLGLMPFWSILEGCNQIDSVYRYRALRALVLGITIWISLMLGAGLWSLGFGYVMTTPLTIGLLGGRNWRLLCWIFSSRGEEQVPWRTEILPLQWRLAASFASGYFAQWGITPITFQLFSPAVAGQFGMMWSIINALSAVANVVMTVRAPQLGILVASRRYGELDRVALRAGIISVMLSWLGCAVVAIVIAVLALQQSPLASRVLPLGPALLMLLATALMQVVNPLAIYLRSHKREPYLWPSVGFAVSLVASTLVFGRWFGPLGVTITYFALVAGFFLPVGVWIFIRCRHAWHTPQFGA